MEVKPELLTERQARALSSNLSAFNQLTWLNIISYKAYKNNMKKPRIRMMYRARKQVAIGKVIQAIGVNGYVSMYGIFFKIWLVDSLDDARKEAKELSLIPQRIN